MDRRIRALLAVLIAGLLVVLVALSAAAAGLGVGPPNMEIADAERGQQYERTIFVNYNNETDCIIELSASGEISNWVTFYDYPSDPTTPIESKTAPNAEWTYVLVKFDIPSDAPIGNATGALHVLTVAPEGAEGAAGLSLVGQVDVTIYIAGEGEEDGETPAPTPTSTPTPPLDMTPTPAPTTPSTTEEEAPLNVWIIVGPILGVLGAGGAGYYLATKRR